MLSKRPYDVGQSVRSRVLRSCLKGSIDFPKRWPAAVKTSNIFLLFPVLCQITRRSVKYYSVQCSSPTPSMNCFPVKINLNLYITRTKIIKIKPSIHTPPEPHLTSNTIYKYCPNKPTYLRHSPHHHQTKPKKKKINFPFFEKQQQHASFTSHELNTTPNSEPPEPNANS